VSGRVRYFRVAPRVVPEVPTVVPRTDPPPSVPMAFSAWIAASFSRWVVRTRPDERAKSTSHSRRGIVRRTSSISSRRKARGPSTRNAMYRYRGRRVLTLGYGREMEKGSGKKRRRSAYFVHFSGRLHRTRVDFFAQKRLRLDAGDHEQDPDCVLQVVL